MGKLRVHELAKMLNISSVDVIAKLNAKGIAARTHSSSVDEKAAYEALGLSPKGEVLKTEIRPRTVLRRRVEEKTEPEAVEVEPEAFIETAATETLKPESHPERPASTEPENLSSSAINEKAIDVREPEKQVTLASPTKPLAPPPPRPASALTEATPSNVVRVIDAEAIKARLAGEGRSFQRRPQPAPGGQRSGAGGERGGLVSPQVIEIGRSSEAGAGQKPGMRPAKKKRGASNSGGGYSRERDSSMSGRELWLTPGRKKKNSKIKVKGPQITQAAAHKRVVEMTDAITVNELAHAMSIKAGQVVSKLLSMGMMVTVNEAIDFDTATIVANEFGFEVKNVAFEETEHLKEKEDAADALEPRSAIVTVMGHVDHGKTSFLDALRESAVAKGEAGGITQHIGAYSVETSHGPVTFLDTPGHEAFTSMRARGAQVTDIVVLVVAADDGVMPQTREAIDHAKAAGVPVVVAVNKMDLPTANPQRVMQQLSELGLQPEEWGGDTQFFKVSALKKTGLKELVEGLGVLAEVLELKANPNKPGSGCVIEAKLDKGRGPVATILMQTGTIKQGDYIVAGECMGRIRGMFDSNGRKVVAAGPSVPVQVLGLSNVPKAGDRVNAVADDKTAKTISGYRAQKTREQELLKTNNISLETFLASTPVEEVRTLRLIIKADVFGSAEALTTALRDLSTKEVKVEIIHSGVGTITESNVNLALASKAIIIGFNIKADGKAQMLAQQEKVDVRYYSVIYDAINEVKKAMVGLLAPIFQENYLGKAEVRMIISVSKYGKIAGSYVLDGKIIRAAKIRIKRDNKELFVGNIGGLKRFKDDVKEVGAGYECGIVVDGFSDIQEGDILECFELKEVEAKLSGAISAQSSSNESGMRV